MTLFRNKSVLVLGGSRGIGAAIVRRFSADGASVVFSYAGSREAAEKLAAETGSTAIQTDSADRDAVISLVREYGYWIFWSSMRAWLSSAMRWNKIAMR